MLSSEDQNEIAQGKDRYRADVERVRKNTRLSHEGKQLELAKLWTEERRRVGAIRENAATRVDERKATLRKQLFHAGTTDPAAVASFRSALDKVETVNDPTELRHLLERALGSGDTSLAKAAASRAFDRHTQALTARNRDEAEPWRKVVATYVQDNQRDGKAFEELAGIIGTEHNPNRSMTDSMAVSVPVPPELSNYAHVPHQIEHMADNPA